MRVPDPAYERLPRAAELFLTRDAAGDLRHAVVVVRLGRPDPAASGTLTLERLTAQVASRLHLVPARFRRVVRFVPLGLAGPILVDDAGFDLRRHVRAISTATSISEVELAKLIDDYSSQPLDRSRPLWEIGLTPELEDGGRAILLKMHHALVEGEGGVANAALLVFDASPDAGPGEPEPWRPEPAPGRFAEARLAVRDQARRFAAVARGPYSVERVTAAAGGYRDAYRGYRNEVAGRRAQPRFRPPASGQHATSFAVRPMAQVEEIRNAAGPGATFNDVLLTGIAGGLRRWQAEVGLANTDLVAAVPVNLSRQDGDVAPVLTELPSFMLVRLPVTEPDPRERLRLVGLGTAHGKRVAPRLAEAASALAQLPAPLYRRLANRLYDRAPDFYLANIQGPNLDLYVLGHRVEFAYITGRTRSQLRVAALSFAGSVTIGIACHLDRVPRPEALARCFEEEFEALAASYLAGAGAG